MPPRSSDFLGGGLQLDQPTRLVLMLRMAMKTARPTYLRGIDDLHTRANDVRRVQRISRAVSRHFAAARLVRLGIDRQPRILLETIR
jgi:hypothetical protein